MTLEVLPHQQTSTDASREQTLEAAREVLDLQSAIIAELAKRLDESYCRALDIILACRGRVVVAGIGKSGLIGRKIAATFACTGTPSLYLHPGEAAHGDLGMVTRGDVVVFISNSGEIEEINRLIPHFRELEVPIIAMVGSRESTLAKWADVVLDISVEREACPLNLVPTSSTLATLAMGDALAVSLMRARGFQADDFAKFHPGGFLGRGLLNRVRDAMHSTDLPLVSPEQSVGESLLAMTQGRCGLAIVVDEERALLGVFTDGDLRRALQRRRDLRQLPISEIMTRDPVTVREDANLREAQQRMRRLRLQALIVLDAEDKVVGVVQIFNGQ